MAIRAVPAVLVVVAPTSALEVDLPVVRVRRVRSLGEVKAARRAVEAHCTGRFGIV